MGIFVNDIVFGWRQLRKRRVTSAAVILSLALAIGACTATFRLIDALLLRPLPVARAQQLYAVTRQGTFFDGRSYASQNCWSYPAFLQMRAAVKDQAELLAIPRLSRSRTTISTPPMANGSSASKTGGWRENDGSGSAKCRTKQLGATPELRGGTASVFARDIVTPKCLHSY